METITKYFKEEQDPLYRKGEMKGLKAGKEEGLKAGEHKKAVEAAIKMKKSGFDVNIIADLLDLSVEEIEKLK